MCPSVCKPAKHGVFDGPGCEPHSHVSLIFESALPTPCVGTTTGSDFGEVGSSADVDDSERDEVEARKPQSKALTTGGAERHRSLGRQLSTQGNSGVSQVGVP